MASGSPNQNSCLPVARRSTTNNKKNSRQVLPNDVISKILSFLPAKSICKFKCCSKFFSELTEDKYFLKQQSDNSLLKDDTCFFIQRRNYPSSDAESGLKIHSLHKQNASSSSCGVHTRFLEFLALTDAKIVASSNGLLLCKIYSKLVVCNPTTLSCSYIPSPICTDRFIHEYVNLQYVFEFDSEEFKLFAFNDSRIGRVFECSIYDSKIDVWKVKKELFDLGDWPIEFKSPVFYKGIIHVLSLWKPDCGYPYIATYDVENGMSRRLRIPRSESKEIHIDYPLGPYLHIKPHKIAGIFKWGRRGSSDESICLVTLENWCFLSIWVLSDYEAKRWSSFKQVNLKEMGLVEEDLYVVDFIVMNGDCLMFATKKSVYKYDLVGEREGRLEQICEHEYKWYLSLIPYSSTLHSCVKPLHTWMNI